MIDLIVAGSIVGYFIFGALLVRVLSLIMGPVEKDDGDFLFWLVVLWPVLLAFSVVFGFIFLIYWLSSPAAAKEWWGSF